MKNKEITLDFEKSLTKLSGFDLGKALYDSQIKEKIDYTEDKIIIQIPQQVDLVGSSFIQGFFEDMVNKIGISGIEERVIIKSSISNLKQIIIDNLN